MLNFLLDAPLELELSLHIDNIKIVRQLSPYPLNNMVLYQVNLIAFFISLVRTSHLSPSHRAFTSSLTITNEPKTFNQAVKHVEWREAMHKEVQALQANNT